MPPGDPGPGTTFVVRTSCCILVLKAGHRNRPGGARGSLGLNMSCGVNGGGASLRVRLVSGREFLWTVHLSVCPSVEESVAACLCLSYRPPLCPEGQCMPGAGRVHGPRPWTEGAKTHARGPGEGRDREEIAILLINPY